MNDKKPTRRKRKNLFRQIVGVGLILAVTFLVTLLAVPRFIVVPTSTPPSAPIATADLPGRIFLARARGNIYDRKFKKMAVTCKTCTIVAHPLELTDPLKTAARLAEALEIDKIDLEQLARTLHADQSTVPLAWNIDQPRAAKIAALDLPGICVSDEMVRWYPNGKSAAHILGYVGKGNGLAGVEFQYNALLQGGEINEAGQDRKPLTTDGAHLVLSADIEIQAMIEKQLQSLVDDSGAEGATAVLLDPRTGAVLSLVSIPTFDPNNFSQYNESAHRNRVMRDRLPLGSLGDIFQLAAALDRDDRQGRETPQEETLNPDVPLLSPLHHKRTLAVRLLDLDDATQAAFADRLGFGRPPAIDLPLFSKEPGVSNAIPAFEPWTFRPESHARSTTLGLAVAFSELINGGHRITPQLVAGVYNRVDGRPLPLPSSLGEKNSPALPVLTEEVSQGLLEILPRLGRTGPADSIFFDTVTPDAPMAVAADPTTVAQLAQSLRHTEKGKLMQEVLFGFIPAADPEIVLVMALSHPDPARFPKKEAGSSQLLALARRVLPRAKEKANETVKKTFAEILNNTEVPSLTNWKIEQQTAIAAAMAQESNSIRMPNVLGKSLRGGLQLLQHYDLRIRVVGTGRIVTQHPKPDTMVPVGEECVLQLNLDN